ncbi:MAG: hypothetical protein WBE41_19620 [Terracidiphilus sp.]
MERRSFLKAAATSAAALVFDRRQALAQQADSHIEIMVDEPIGTIAPEIYGHFTEHLGSVIYDGIYVGENSMIANQQGLRTALIEKMRADRSRRRVPKPRTGFDLSVGTNCGNLATPIRAQFT